MAFSEFFSKWNGKYCEVSDPTNPNQCFDLVVAWTDSLGIPRTFNYMYAYQIYSNFGTEQAKYFDKIYNGPAASPRQGDIPVWSWYFNYSGGHTGVATGKGVTTGTYTDWFECFEQNDPLKSVCHLKTYSYSNVLGWLRPKNYGIPLTDTQKWQATAIMVDDTTIPDSDFRYKVRKLKTG